MSKEKLIREIQNRFHPNNFLLQDRNLSWWVGGLGDNGYFFEEKFNKLSEDEIETLLVDLYLEETIARKRAREDEHTVFGSEIWEAILNEITEDPSCDNGFVSKGFCFHERCVDILEDFKLLEL
jgi:hypothetical protein